tara:strand:- start:912 stop:1640 length:729 start_codon:yes stop_codon:yes gene_type:complete
MANKAHTSHVGSCLSCADILAVLYGSVMDYRADDPEWEGGDRFVMGKGHASAALYATLAECGFFPVGMLDSHCRDGSLLLGHVNHELPGVDVSTGALGHGLSIGCGMAMITESRVFVLLGDGDLNEGSTWEAVMFAAQHKLGNLVGIVDYNHMQALGGTREILDLETLSYKWESFGWEAWAVDGHSHYQLEEAIASESTGKPKCVVAYTVKGRGVEWMEGVLRWHYAWPDNKELKLALEGLE